MTPGAKNRIRLTFKFLLFTVYAPLLAQGAIPLQLDSTDILLHLHGVDDTAYIGNRISSVGDINSDGYDDIAVSSLNPRGMYIFYGGDPPDSIPDYLLKGSIGPAVAIDITGDGINDLITSQVYDPYVVREGRIYFYRGYGDSIATEPFDSITRPTENDGLGAWINAAYVDSDNLGDILTFRPYTFGCPTLIYYSGAPTLDTIPDWSFRNEGVSRYFHNNSFGFIDFDGDSQLDIFLGLMARNHLTDSLGYVYIFRGPSFDTLPDFVIGPPSGGNFDTLPAQYFGEFVSNVGDFNGDGWDDVLISYYSRMVVYFCGPGMDTLYDLELQGRGRFAARAGDINGDGYDDVISGNIDYTEFGTINIYLGGPKHDAVYDDIITNQMLPHIALDDIGYIVSPAGDMNNDGIDDFMFSCLNYTVGEPGDVFIFRGSDKIVTDVDEPKDDILPTEFRLNPNHPNPFNSSTTFSFDIPRRDQITLSIYDITGRKLRTLIDKELSPGSYSVTWDGRNSKGESVSTGIYLCRLKSSSQAATRKLLLLK